MNNYCNFFIKLIALLLILTMVFSISSINMASAIEENENKELNVAETFDDYDAYLINSQLSDAKEINTFFIKASEYAYLNGNDIKAVNDYMGESDAIIFETGKGEVTYEINVLESAMYYIDFTYLPLKGNGSNVEFEFKIDGEYPFSACERLNLIRYWIDSGEHTVDDSGNEYTSEQKEYGEFITRHLMATDGVESRAYKFALNKGKHTITIVARSQGFALSKISFSAPDKIVDYEEYVSNQVDNESINAAPIVVEGEDAWLKSTRSMVALADNTDVAITPSSAFLSKLNYIGGKNWQSPSEEITWKFRVAQSGWYKLGFSYKQDTVINSEVYRTLKIDGKIPFNEAEKIGYKYSTSWEFEAFKDAENKDYLFYLTEGDHTLSLTATLGEITSIYKQLKELILEMGQLYIDVIMITGESPDVNRDYILFKQLPDFNKKLEDFSSSLNNMSSQFYEITGEESNQFVAAFNNTVRVMQDMLDNPYQSHLYIKDFYTQYTTLGSLLSEMANVPLALDQVQFTPADSEFNIKKSGFFSDCIFGIKRFLASFTNDYRTINSNANNEKQLKIWINWGRDQAMVLDSLIKQSFTPKTGISVNLELTNASLIKGMLSNTQPDLQLHMSRTEPVNLAMRGALYDLKNFNDYEDVITRFIDGATVPYTYKDGVYALPDTQNFYLMFYRKDIFEKLNLKVPETWDEFLEVTANIERNNMTVSLPYTQITSTTTVNNGVGGLNLFPTILQQRGGQIYNDELNACTLREPIALEAFTFWTEMYTKYKIPTTQNFYNRFKVGTCPLGIDVYTMYTQISEAAPEIEGSWGIALVPGYKQADGTINRTVSGSGSGCAILEKSEHKDEAWRFIKWWTSADTQLSYNNNVESILGSISRTTTATVEAFEKMSWNEDDLSILLEQRENIVEVPEIPGGYYLTRSVDQAYWQVINKTKNVKDALVYWSDVANNEITRKIKQYS